MYNNYYAYNWNNGVASFGQESFNAENGGLNYVLPADNGYYFLCSGHIYFWNGDVTKQAVPLCSSS